MKHPELDLLIFDWDGTLADSAGLIVDSMQAAIVALDLPARGDEEIRQLIGLGLDDVLRTLYPELDQVHLLSLLEAYRRQFVGSGHNEAGLFEGALEVMAELHATGYRLAIATGKSRNGLERALNHHHSLRPLLSASRTADETASKPNPLMLRDLLRELGVPPQRSVMIGDTDFDLDMARAAGVVPVAVKGGAHPLSRLQDARPAAILDGLMELPGWLKRYR
jgi:phosphoglycolate phosphatase